MKKILLSTIMASLLTFTSVAYAGCEQSDAIYYVLKDGSVSKKTGEYAQCANMFGGFTSVILSDKLSISAGSRNDENGEPLGDYFEFNANGEKLAPVKIPRPREVPKDFTCYTSSSLLYGYCVSL